MERRYTVLDLPCKRTLEELGECPFLKCLDRSQAVALGLWLRAAKVGEEWRAAWYGDHAPVVVSVRRVS